MRTKIIAVAAAAALIVGMAAPGAVLAASVQVKVGPDAVGFDAGRLKSIDAFMADEVAKGRIIGGTTLLARHGKVVQSGAYGMADAARPMTMDAVFRIYSMSKPLTGVAMMILFEQGKWRLDDPVTRFVPEFKDLKVMTGTAADGSITTEPLKRPPTMRELMSHTAGFGYGLGDKHPVDLLYRQKKVLGSHSLAEMIQRTSDIPLMYQPGTSWYYSSAVDIQGYIVEKISGQTLGAFLEANVFKPLKMADTGFFVHPGHETRLAAVYVKDRDSGRLVEAKELFSQPMPNYAKPPAMESGGGGLVSTTKDYARFCQMMLNKGELDGARILSPASVELMDTNVIPKDVLVNSNGSSVARFNEAVGFGLDFMVVNEPRKAGLMVGKNTMSWGGAAGTWFWIDPTNDLYFVGMIQRLGGNEEDDLGGMTRTLTYQALTHPER